MVLRFIWEASGSRSNSSNSSGSISSGSSSSSRSSGGSNRKHLGSIWELSGKHLGWF